MSPEQSTTTTTTTTTLIKEAARHVKECDFLLIATGAGFSADSGLPTYADVARNPIFEEQDIDYGDLCRISCLLENPSLFYGFWGYCYNSYKKATPHPGHDILKKWCCGGDGRNGGGGSSHQATTTTTTSPSPSRTVDYYIYTSNVDGHHRMSGFPTDRIHEMHGCIDTWLALAQDKEEEEEEEEGNISILKEKVDETPLLICLNNKDKDNEIDDNEDNDTFFPVDPNLEISPDTMKRFLLKNNSPTTTTTAPLLFRPKVLMFDDDMHTHQAMGLSSSSDRYQAWEEHMETEMESSSSSSSLKKLVVLEIGCGTRVPSVRIECEDVVTDTAKRIRGILDNYNYNYNMTDKNANSTTPFSSDTAAAAASPADRVVHIRINPEEYEIDKKEGAEITVLGIQGTALATLQAIDACMNAST